MLLTVAIFIFCSAIFIFFSQEIMSVLKKILEIKIVQLILPLLIGSWLVSAYPLWCIETIISFREFLSQSLLLLSQIAFFEKTTPALAGVALLTSLTLLPVFCLNWITKKRNKRDYSYPYMTSTLIFVVSAVLMIAIYFKNS